jgi:hypothetical protein
MAVSISLTRSAKFVCIPVTDLNCSNIRLIIAMSCYSGLRKSGIHGHTVRESPSSELCVHTVLLSLHRHLGQR